MNALSKYVVEQLIKELNEGVVVLVPGGFKPPHAGHLELVKRYAEQPNVDEVRILIGPKERDGVTRQQAVDIWKLLIGSTSGIKVIEVPSDNPMRAAYEYIEKAEPGTYALGASSKGEDYARVKGFVDGHSPSGKYHRPNVNVVELPIDTKPVLYKGRTDDQNGKGLSASTLRADIAANDFVNFKSNYPGTSDVVVKSIYNSLVNKGQLSEAVVGEYLSKLRLHFKDFLKAVKEEGVETKKALSLLALAAAGKKKLTKQEKEQVGDQLKEALKAAGLVAASVLPGGTIYFILLRLLRLDQYLLPTRFLGKNAVSAGQLALSENKLYEWKPVTNRALLTEGGAAGHMTHPYEDVELTFEEAKGMIEAALNGEISYAQEKLDGQNLMLTYKEGKVRAARNKGQLKNFAEKSITTNELEQMMAGKGAIQTAFTEAMRDMETAINRLNPAQKEEFFQNGKRFVNFEVLYPETANVVPYGTTQLRLHGFKEYDEEGNVIDEDTEGAAKLQAAIESVQAQNQKTYEIRTTDPITIKKSADYDKQRDELLSELDAVRRRYSLNPNDKLGVYMQNWWKEFLESKAKDYNVQLEPNTMQQLINRWAFYNKEVNIRNIKAGITNTDFAKWIDEFDKSGAAAQQKEARKPIENIFLKLGVYVLQNVEQLVALNYNDSVASMRKSLADTIRQIRSMKDAQPGSSRGGLSPLDFLKRELTRLKDIGGFKAIVPTEGIVFKHKGKLYKLTGAFAPINQILGYLRF